MIFYIIVYANIKYFNLTNNDERICKTKTNVFYLCSAMQFSESLNLKPFSMENLTDDGVRYNLQKKSNLCKSQFTFNTGSTKNL